MKKLANYRPFSETLEGYLTSAYGEARSTCIRFVSR